MGNNYLFQNTLGDLLDCKDRLLDDDLSDDEQSAREKLVALCREIAESFDEDDRP